MLIVWRESATSIGCQLIHGVDTKLNGTQSAESRTAIVIEKENGWDGQRRNRKDIVYC